VLQLLQYTPHLGHHETCLRGVTSPGASFICRETVLAVEDMHLQLRLLPEMTTSETLQPQTIQQTRFSWNKKNFAHNITFQSSKMILPFSKPESI